MVSMHSRSHCRAPGCVISRIYLTPRVLAVVCRFPAASCANHSGWACTREACSDTAYGAIQMPGCSPSWRICRSEEHTSELQSRLHLVCRLLLEKKNKHHRQS